MSGGVSGTRISSGRMRLFMLGVAVCLGAGTVSAWPSDYDKLAEEGIQVLSDYLRIDTSNPPGNVLEGARFLTRILEEEGIPHRLLEAAPGRATVYARLKGSGREGPLVLLHHIDVVPAEERFWTLPPFSGEIREGYLWGRGALDSKSLGVAQLMTFLSLKRSGRPLKRDVILLATPDEETGGMMGVDWLLSNHFTLFSNVAIVLNEGGNNLVRDGRLLYVGIEHAQKAPLWLRLSVKSQPGHGAVPRGDTATVRLVRALEKIIRYEPPIRLVPDVVRYFRSIAQFQPPDLRERFLNVHDAARNPDFLRRLSPYHQALLRNTVSLTVLRAGEATNMIPTVAYAELDCRLLPGETAEEFMASLSELVGDPAVQFDVLLRHETVSSRLDTGVLEAIREATLELQIDAQVGPSVMPGFTESPFFRARGIAAYGFSPFQIREAEASGIHGNNERISVDSFRFGLRFLHSVVSRLVY